MFVSSGNEVKAWNSDTNDLIVQYSPKNHSLGTIHSFSIRPDNAQIACVFESGCIKFINSDTGFNDEILDVSDPKACCFDSIGRQFAVGTMNSYIEIFDIKSHSLKKKLWKINPPSGPVNCISWSKTDRNLATGHPNGCINLFNSVMYNFSTPLIHPKLNDLKSPIVTTLQWSLKNPPQLLSGYDDGSVILWDTIKSQPVSVIKAHNTPCTTVLSGLGPSLLLISSCLDGYLNLYDCTTNRTVKTIQCHSSITSCDLSANGYTMCVGTISGYIQLIDIRHNQQPLNTFKAHETAVHFIKYANNFSHKPKSTNTSISSNQSSQIEGHSLIKKSNSYNFDLNQHNNLNPTLSNPNTLSIYSPENQRAMPKIRAQNSGGNLSNFMDPSSNESRKTNFSLPLSSTNINTPTSLNRFENSKVSKERGDLYSPVANGPSNDDNNSNGHSKNNGASPYSLNNLAPKMSSTKISQGVSPKIQSSIKIQVSNISGEKMTIGSPVKTESLVDPNKSETKYFKNSNGSEDSEQNGSPAGFSLPLDMVREIVNDSVDNLKYELMSENFKFKAEMIREFMEMKKCIEESFKAASVNDALVAEIQRLREENKRLKKHIKF